MAEVKLKAERRDGTGKGVARRIRSDGRVPAIVYGRGMVPIPIAVDRREFVTALQTDAGMNVLLDIEVDGDTTLALTRELQRDPVRGTLLHADFVKVDRLQEIEIEVPVHVAGEAPGVKEGGVLEHPLFTVHVRCLPTNVPERVEADISSLEVGDLLRVSDLATGRDFQILNDPEAVVVSIAAPITVEALEALEAEAGVEKAPSEIVEAEGAAGVAEEAGQEGPPAKAVEDASEAGT